MRGLGILLGRFRGLIICCDYCSLPGVGVIGVGVTFCVVLSLLII